MQQRKNFENRSVIGQDIDKTLWLTFFGPPCKWQNDEQQCILQQFVCRCVNKCPRRTTWSTYLRIQL